MNLEKTIYLLRHGETEYNRQGFIQGRGTNASLNANGRKQALAFYRHYQHIPIDMIITSSLRRSFQTVGMFIRQGTLWHVLPDLDEISWGIHEGQPPDPWVLKSYRRLVDHWSAGQYEARVDGGESAGDLARRTDRFLDFVRVAEARNILVCSHGRTIRCMMTRMKGEPLSDMEKYRHSNTGLFTVVVRDGRFEILGMNDTRHLS